MSIEIKKYPKADLSRYKGLIFSFSLALTLSIMIMAFEWKSYDKSVIDLQERSVNSFELLNEVPPTEILPPPAPVISQPRMVEVPDEVILEEVKIKIDIEMNQDTRIEEITLAVQPDVPVIEKEDVDAIFTVVESPAVPFGGFEAFYKDIGSRIEYPAQARRMGVEGKVFVEFVVNRDGSLTDFKVVKGIGSGCDEEAVEVLAAAPKWKPAKQRGNSVRQRMILPIFFVLANK